jgi:ferredoxin
MKVKYDRNSCSAWFQCVQKWDAFQMNMAEGKADLDGAHETDDGIYVRDVSEDAKEAAKSAAETCPVDAITVSEDGN